MNPTQRVTREIVEQAQAWFITNREHGLSTDQRREFLVWLQASPMHVREYLATAKLASDLRGIMGAIDNPVEELIAEARNAPDENVVTLDSRPTPSAGDQSQTAASRARPLIMFAAAIGALAVAVLGWWWSVTPRPAHHDYRTARGEQRTVGLNDGSVLHLNTDSLVHVDYGKAERKVSVSRGQVLFRVVKDKLRPFRVSVGATEVIVVGTEFDVRQLSDDVVVTVVKGSVALAKLSGSRKKAMSATRAPLLLHPVSMTGIRAPIDRTSEPGRLRLTAGQQAHVVGGSLPATRKAIEVRAVDVRPAIAWVQQKIMFERETLQKVAAEFNRYSTTQLMIDDPHVATLRISGTFNAYDLESFVLYLENLRGLKVDRGVNEIRISPVRNDTGQIQ